MRMHRFVTVSSVVALAAFGGACGKRGGGDEPAPADSVQPAQPSTAASASGVSASSGPSAGSTTYELVAINPMSHDMQVSVRFPQGGKIRLGTVPANGQSRFTLPASAGETVILLATDEGGTHHPEKEVLLPPDQSSTTWTIQ